MQSNMDGTSFKHLEKLIPTTYVQQAKDAQNTTLLLVNQLLEKVGSFYFLSMSHVTCISSSDRKNGLKPVGTTERLK